MTKQKLLITGSLGFIASNLIRNIIYEYKNYEIIGVDRANSSLSLNSIYINKNQRFYLADITDEHILDRIMEYEKPDIVLHMAALTDVSGNITNSEHYIHNNVLGTQIVLEAALKWKVKKFIYMSTNEIINTLGLENNEWQNTLLPSPATHYASSKLAGEKLVIDYGKADNLNYCIIRSANCYGSRQTNDRFIPRAIKTLLNNEKITLYGTGKNIRDWLFIGDCCSGIMKVIEKGTSNETYNISANQDFSDLETAHLICEYMNRSTEVNFISSCPGPNDHIPLDTTKLQQLGWKYSVRFKDGLKNTIDWYKLNLYWLS